LRSRLRDLISPFEAGRQSTRVAEIRRELGHRSQELARLLKTVRGAKLAIPIQHAVAAAFVTLDSLTPSGSTLPPARRRYPSVLPGRASSTSRIASRRSAAIARQL
jgi:hypothetical protein